MGLWWGEWLGLEECRGKFVGGDGWILGERTGRLRLLCEVLRVCIVDVYEYVIMVGHRAAAPAVRGFVDVYDYGKSG